MKMFNDYIVNTKVLENNIINIKNTLDGQVKLCAIVKANAYGLGIETVCKSIRNHIDFFAVACLKEALRIRVFDKETKILILGHISSEDLDICSKNNISISISNMSQLEYYQDIMCNPVNVHIQVNTGLNRYGVKTLTEFKKVYKYITGDSRYNLEGVYSHFATKSNDKVFIKKQYLRFLQFKHIVKEKNVIFHIANSYATIFDEHLHLNMVRCGFLTYGEMQNNIGNSSVLSITSRVVNILQVKKGDTIGYDRTYKVNKETRIAVVSIGYADGFDRHLSNNFSVIINNTFCKVVGLVCMDVFMVDVSNIDIKLFDKVIILGKQGRLKITLSDYAKVLKTSPYEVLLRFNYKRMNYIVKNE